MPDNQVRVDGRRPDQLREIKVTRGFIDHAEGSVLFEAGKTRVLVTASVEDRIPDFLKGSGKGWVTAEYSMLPRATATRTSREVNRGRPGGRTQEIQRLIGRSLRAVCDLKRLGERSIWLDCDVIQADGGTRTASITAAYIALADACSTLVESGKLASSPVTDEVAAISVGIIDETPMLDLCYVEDSRADVDMNVVMTGSGSLVEIQGTAEGVPFSRGDLDALVDLAQKGIDELVELQRRTLSS